MRSRQEQGKWNKAKQQAKIIDERDFWSTRWQRNLQDDNITRWNIWHQEVYSYGSAKETCEVHIRFCLMSHITEILLTLILMKVRNKIKPEHQMDWCICGGERYNKWYLTGLATPLTGRSRMCTHVRNVMMTHLKDFIILERLRTEHDAVVEALDSAGPPACVA